VSSLHGQEIPTLPSKTNGQVGEIWPSREASDQSRTMLLWRTLSRAPAGRMRHSACPRCGVVATVLAAAADSLCAGCMPLTPRVTQRWTQTARVGGRTSRDALTAALFARLAARKTKRTLHCSHTRGQSGDRTGRTKSGRPRCVPSSGACTAPRRVAIRDYRRTPPRQKENSEQPLRALRGSHAKKSALKVIPVFL